MALIMIRNITSKLLEINVSRSFKNVLTDCNSFYGHYNANKIVKNNYCTMSNDNHVILNEIGDKGLIILNKPQVLNALRLSMLSTIHAALKKWETTKKFVIIKSSTEKAFCAGGDVKYMTSSNIEPEENNEAIKYFRVEYPLNHYIGTYKIPYIALINGITLGGGAGLSVHGKYCIATEKTVFAMPETAIGLFPDAGGTHFLSKLKGKLGLYLGLTGHRLRGEDLKIIGLATHFVPSEKMNELTEALLTLDNNDIDELLSSYEYSDQKGELSIRNNLTKIDKCFSGDTVEEIVALLKEDNSEFARNTLETLSLMSPTSLKITKKAYDKGKNLCLKECVKMEFRLAYAASIKKGEFHEGCRALLVDKDKKPLWNPKTLEEVSDEYIDSKFNLLPAEKELNI